MYHLVNCVKVGDFKGLCRARHFILHVRKVPQRVDTVPDLNVWHWQYVAKVIFVELPE